MALKRVSRRTLRRKGRRLRGMRTAGVKRGYAPGLGPMPLRKRARTNRLRLGRVGRMRTARRVARRNRMIGDAGGYNQWRQYKFTKRLGNITQQKINRLSMDRLVLYWRAMNALVGQGRLYMNHCSNADNSVSLPCYLVELNCVPNMTSYSSTVVANTCPVYSVKRAGSSNTSVPLYSFPNQEGQTRDGTSGGYNWMHERVTGFGAYGTAAGPRTILQWADVRFDLWGCKTQPTKYDIMLCQFHNDVTPDPNAQTNNINQCRFWDQLLRPYCYNPNLHQVGFGMAKKMRVLWHKSVMIDPTETSESDPDPHVKSVKCFWRFNRRCKYDYRDDAGVTAFTDTDIVTVPEFTTSEVPEVNSQMQNRVHKNARIFVMIRATKYIKSATFADQTSSDTPSINLQVRTCHIRDR